jgi:RecA-family ATPase
VPFRQKGPKLTEWPRLRINNAEQVARYFRGPTNVGIILGTASDGLVDVDLDCEEACRLADAILPTTHSIFGRPGKPRSHRLYRVINGPSPTCQFTDPTLDQPEDKDMIVELRGDKKDGGAGYQTVFPGSIHESDEEIEWVEDGEPARIEYQELKRCVTSLAITSLITRHAPHARNFEEAYAALDKIDPRLSKEIKRWKGDAGAAQQVQQSIPAPATGLAHLARTPRRIGDTAQLDEYPPLQFTEHDIACLWTMLIFIDARPRKVWRDIGFAVHDIVAWPEALRRAVWDRWSIELDTPPPGGNKKFEQPKQDATWHSFGRNYDGDRITVATIDYRAREGGWDGTLKPLPDELRRFLPTDPAAAPPPELETFRGDELLSTAAPPRRWLVEPWIPAAETTMLGGDGGTGKTTAVLQLAVAAVSGQDWLGRKVEPCNVLYASAEDPKEEIHFRLEQITKHLNITEEQLARFKLIDLAGKDSTVVLFDSRSGQLKTTGLFAEIEKAAQEHNAGCIIIDAVADFFGGNENERREVRAFVGLLRGLAMRQGAAVVIIAHPSVDGIKTGRGYSGSTHWNNAVRSRLYFTDVPDDDESRPPNPDLRVIELAKSNRARRGEKAYVLWLDGRFVLSAREAGRNLANEAKNEELFLQLLEKTTKQGVSVGLSRHSSTFAPGVFAKMSAAQGTGKAALEAAMHRLIEQGRIRDEASGSPSRVRHRLALAAQAKPAPGGNGAPFFQR